MEIVNMMFERCGGGQMARIFRSYLVLALLIKELMFSLFMMSENQPTTDPTPEKNMHILYTIKAATFGGDV